MRESRQEEINRRQQDKSQGFDPDKLFKLYGNQLGSLLSKWWDLEKVSWEESPPADAKLGADNLKNELESLVELELEKIKSEIEEIKESEPSWKPESLDLAQKSFEKNVYELIANYSLKIDSLTGQTKKDIQITRSARGKISAGGSRNSASAGGIWLLFMFILGLLLGAAPTVYYMDLARKNEEKINQSAAQYSVERKTFIGKLSVLQEAYGDLAYGRIKNIPQLENTIGPIRKEIAQRKEELEKEFIRKQANLIKKIPAGDRLDKSLQNLKETEQKQLAILKAEEENRTEPLLKEINKHKSILEGSE